MLAALDSLFYSHLCSSFFQGPKDAVREKRWYLVHTTPSYGGGKGTWFQNSFLLSDSRSFELNAALRWESPFLWCFVSHQSLGSFADPGLHWGKSVLLESSSEDLGRVAEIRDGPSVWGRFLFLKSPMRGSAEASTPDVEGGSGADSLNENWKSQAKYQHLLLVSSPSFRGEVLVGLVCEKDAPAGLHRTQSQIRDWTED